MAGKISVFDRSNNLNRYGKKCYTEDDILIYTLYISNIPESISSSRLKQYFSGFGEVETLRYKNKYKIADGYRQRAIVKFRNPESASKTLRIRFHQINDVALAVRGADSWIQPHKTRLKSLIKIDDNDTENFQILKLNDYCLFNVFSYITFQDQVHMSAICDRFKKIFILMYKNQKFLKLNSANSFQLSLLEIYESITSIGKFIESIEIDCRLKKFNRIYDFILKYFTNLKKLHMENLNNKFCNSNKEIPLFLKKLTHLTMKNCSITDVQVKKFAKLERLEYLDVSDNEELVGKYLHNLKKLRHLSINNCEKFETSNLKPILEEIPLKTLKVIGIRNADAIGSPFFRFDQLELEEFHFTSYRSENSFLKTIPTFRKLTKIRIYFTQLEVDDIGLRDFLVSCVNNKSEVLIHLGLISQHLRLNSDNIDNLVKLKNLKELELNHLTDADCLFWTKLSLLKELEELSFYCDQINFDENEFCSWMKKSNNIRKITAKFNKRVIKMDFISSAIDILKEINSNNRSVKLYIYGLLKTQADNSNYNILIDPKYLANKEVINVNLIEDDTLYDETNTNKLRESPVNNVIRNDSSD